MRNCTINGLNSYGFSGGAGFIGQISSGTNPDQYVFDNCEVSGLKFGSTSGISECGGFVGNGYWRGYKGLTFTFNNCTADISKVEATSVKDMGAFMGATGNNTVNFTGTNKANTAGTGIQALFGTRKTIDGDPAVVNGEDTVAFIK